MTSATDIDKGIPPAGQDLALLAQLRESAVVRQLVPPLTLEQLYAQVDAFIRETASDPVFRDWLVVMLNNCLWEETIATIPCDKRVLLLPECLKHSGKCQAEHDDFGLLCGCCFSSSKSRSYPICCRAATSSFVSGSASSSPFDKVSII